MPPPLSILKCNNKFTSYKFYSEFILDVALYYKEGNKNPIEFKLTDEEETQSFEQDYYIDPTTLPLLLSLFNQLKKFHHSPLTLHLSNSTTSNRILKFLTRSDFFKLAGSDHSYEGPAGQNLLQFDEIYLGNFTLTNQRKEHCIRAYSLEDTDIKEMNLQEFPEETQRDLLSSHFTYLSRTHFNELLNDNKNTLQLHNTFINILSELITNGVLHGQATTFALMFVDRFKTKFSISDNGIGLSESLKKKENVLFTAGQLAKEIKEYSTTKYPNEKLSENLYTILESLYFSSIKEREGIIDLLINVVLNCNGYFRLHSENCQLIFSSRIRDFITTIKKQRDLILNIFHQISLGIINNNDETNNKLINATNEMRSHFFQLHEAILEKYNSDPKYSSVRFFNVRFKGVHIEAEIPKN